MDKQERDRLRGVLNDLIEACENHPCIPYEISAYRLRALLDHIDALEGRLVENGEIAKPPCFICGYNGAGYFNPEAHPCAERHHAALTQAEEKGK